MTHRIFPGSVELKNGFIQAAVHVGPDEWTPEGLRYVRADPTCAEKGQTVLEFLGRVYDNSEGCLTKGDFKMKEST